MVFIHPLERWHFEDPKSVAVCIVCLRARVCVRHLTSVPSVFCVDGRAFLRGSDIRARNRTVLGPATGACLLCFALL